MRRQVRSFGILCALGLPMLPWLAAIGDGASRPPAVAREPSPPGIDAPDDEERRIEEAMARRSFEDNCLMCHAEEMTTGQRLSPQQWSAEVEKMVGWGAPVPEEERGRLVRYLSERYPADAPAAEVARMSPGEALALERPKVLSAGLEGADPARGAELYAKNCASCHGADATGGDLGTNLVLRPVLSDAARYAAVVRDGLRRMPAFQTALDEGQESDILAWLRDRRGGP